MFLLRILTLSILLISYHSSAQVAFVESAISSGLQFEYFESLKMGGGAASFDYDNDGDDDIYVVGGQNPDGLFENDGEGNFTNIGLSSNVASITATLMTTSVVTGDIDNDGYREIFVGTIGNVGEGFNSIQPNYLLKYDPVTSSYTDIMQSSQIENASFCMGGHFFDSNQDGFLDLYIMNYVEIPKLIVDGNKVVGFDHECYENKLYINQGNGTFIDLTSESGLNHKACTLAATSSDLDWDGDPDIIIANDFGEWIVPNQLYQNNGPNEPYTEVSEQSNTNAKMYGMGIGIGDFDEDLDLDFYVTNIGKNAFFRNEGDMTFTNVAESLNLQNEYTEDNLNTTGWGAIMEDFNNDTYIDIFVSNGYVYSAVDVDDEEQYDELFFGNSNIEFTRVTPDCGIDFTGPSRGALYGDWNADGALDLITITNENTGFEPQNSINYYQNNNLTQNWIGFKLQGTSSNRDGFGSKGVVYADGRAFLREVRGGDSHASQNASMLHFGLGDIETVDSLVLYWPSGIIETINQPDINQYTTVTEGISTSVNNEILTILDVYPNPVSEKLFINIPEELDLPLDVQLINSMRQIVMSKRLISRSNILETENLPAGIYVLAATSNAKVSTVLLTLLEP